MLQVTYSTLIDGCVRKGKLDTGKALLSEMMAAGVQPNAVTYNTLMRAYAKDDKVDMKVQTSINCGYYTRQHPYCQLDFVRQCHMA